MISAVYLTLLYLMSFLEFLRNVLLQQHETVSVLTSLVRGPVRRQENCFKLFSLTEVS